jgi:hypothetical protein
MLLLSSLLLLTRLLSPMTMMMMHLTLPAAAAAAGVVAARRYDVTTIVCHEHYRYEKQQQQQQRSIASIWTSHMVWARSEPWAVEKVHPYTDDGDYGCGHDYYYDDEDVAPLLADVCADSLECCCGDAGWHHLSSRRCCCCCCHLYVYWARREFFRLRNSKPPWPSICHCLPPCLRRPDDELRRRRRTQPKLLYSWPVAAAVAEPDSSSANCNYYKNCAKSSAV